MNFSLRIQAALAILALAACSSGGGTSATVPAQNPAAARYAAPDTKAALIDDWVTLGHDYMRSGYQPQAMNVGRGNVHGMKLRWKRFIGSAACTTPGAPGCMYGGVLAYGGNIIVVSLYGVVDQWETATVYDYQAKTGALLWKYQLADQVSATPSIDPGNNLVIVSTHPLDYTHGAAPEPGSLVALNLTTGHLKWIAKLSGDSHGASVIADNKIYVGNGGGDPPQCYNGGVAAYDELTGKRLWTWLVNPAKNPAGGGSTWGSIGYDGVHLLVPTGNTCTSPVMTADGAVALDPKTGKVDWNFPAQINSYDDDDTGGGVMYSKGQAVFMNKNGTIYSLDARNGHKTWGTQLNPYDGQGGISTPSTNGSIIVVGAGSFAANSAKCLIATKHRKTLPNSETPGKVSYLEGLDTNGSVLWKRQMPQTMNEDVALVNGIGFTGIGDKFVAFDLQHGNVLWSYQGTSIFDPAPAVVPSGVYTADDSGNVYAFDLPK
jgi:outer membrane protein assembly factor BamB